MLNAVNKVSRCKVTFTGSAKYSEKNMMTSPEKLSSRLQTWKGRVHPKTTWRRTTERQNGWRWCVDALCGRWHEED